MKKQNTESEKIIGNLKSTEQENAILRHILAMLPDTPVLLYEIVDTIRLRYVSDAACRHFGMEREELLDSSPFDLDPGLPWNAIQSMQLWPERDRVVSFETHHRTASGEMVPVSVQVKLIQLEGSLFSISIVRRLEQADCDRMRTYSLGYLSSFEDSLPGFLFSCRLKEGQFSVPYVSPNIHSYYGMSPVREHPMVDYEMADLLPERVYPDDRLALLKAFEQSAGSSAIIETDYRIKHPSMGERWMHLRASPHAKDDGSVVWHGFVYDNTEHKRMEETLLTREREFHSLAESSPDNIIRYDRENRIRYLNSNLVNQLKLDSAEEVFGKLPGEAWPDGRFATLEEACARALASGQSQDIELIVPLDEGKMQYHQILVVPERDVSGEIIGTLAFGRDVSEIRETELRLRHFLDNIPGCAYTYRLTPDGQSSFPYLSPSAEEIYGFSPEEARGKFTPIHEYWHPEDQLKLKAATAESARTMSSAHVEVRNNQPGRPERWFDVRSVPERQTDGSILWYGIILNITERKHAEEELRKREREFHSLAENTPDNIARWGTDGRILYSNPTLQRTLGKPASELIGKTHSELFPDGRYTVVDEAIAHIVETGEAVEFLRAPELRADGDTRIHDIKLAPEFDENGRVVSVLGIGHDMTDVYRMQIAIAQREQEFRSLAESSPDSIIRYDKEGRIRYLNSKLERDLGYGIAELDGKLTREVWPDGRFSGIEQAVRQSIADGETRTVIVHAAINTPDPHYHQIRIVPERDGAGQIIGALAFGSDVTDIYRLQESIEAREREFRTLAENSPDVIVRYDCELRRTYINPAWEAANGLRIEEALGKRPTEIAAVVSLLAREFEDQLRQVLESGEPGEIEFGGKDRSDNMKYFSMRVVPEHGEQGAVAGLLTMANDITERKRIEKVLRFIADPGNVENSDGFLTALARFLGEELGVRYVLIDRLADDPGIAETVALYADGGIVPNMSYALKDTPCDNVIGKQACCYPKDVQMLFPQDEILVSMEADSYAGIPLWDSTGKPIGLIAVMNDAPFGDVQSLINVLQLTGPRVAVELERGRSERFIREREQEFRTLVENAPDAIARYDRNCRCIYVNPQFGGMVAGGVARMLGKTPSECPGGENAGLYEAWIMEVFNTGKSTEFEWQWKDRDGRSVCSYIRLAAEYDAEGVVTSVLSVGRDITELSQQRQLIHRMAFFDPLTQLPNRALLLDRLHQMLSESARHGKQSGVMMLDLDRFKEVNDTFGHPVGDLLLREVASRLSACVRGYDTVARLGGDEFAILVQELRSGDDLGRIASKIQESFKLPFVLDGKEVFVGSSIGISLYPTDSENADDLLKHADSAMYFAKRSGRNNFRFYSRELTESANERLLLESELRHGLEGDELVLYFQPKVNLTDGHITGSETLLRWHHPERGMLLPEKFIPIAEDSGQIVDIGVWVLRTACRAACEWNEAGGALHKVAINLSARQFQSGDLLKTVCDVLEQTGCRPEWIELEITESLLLDEDGSVLDILHAFRDMGISIAIDDFGTGFSSLSYLARFPIDTLKIDRSFTSQLTDQGHHAELVKAIISIARSLDQHVVAEGVETVKQSDMLRDFGCYTAQGYLFSKPVPKAMFEALPPFYKLGRHTTDP